MAEEANPFAEFATREPADEENPFAKYATTSSEQPHKSASVWDFVPSQDLPSGGLLPGRYYDPLERQIAKVSPRVANIMAAFGEGAGAAFQERLGLSDESRKFLERAGIFHKPTDDPNIFKSINEGVIGPLATALDATRRLPGAIYGGLQAAGIEAGLPPDIVSIPDAFAGMPHIPGLDEPVRKLSPGELAKAKSLEPLPEAKPAGELQIAPPELERITGAAIQLDDGSIYVGTSHLDALIKAEQETGDANVADRVVSEDHSGFRGDFITNRGRLVGRKEAADIALAAEQATRITPYGLFAEHVDFADARALGVIGPEPSVKPEAPPAETARAATADPTQPPSPPGGGTGGPGEPTGGGSAGGGAETNPWRERFEHFVGKLDAPDDVKALIRKAADENGEFLPARQGDIPLRHVTALADAAGVDPSEINVRGLGRNLKNDAEVRVAMQLMLQVTEDVRTAAREVRADGSPENLIKMQEAIMRRDLAVEQIVGLRAEWGRTGNVFQEFLRDVKDQEALSEFMKKRGRNPQDLKDIASAVDALDRDGAAKMLNELRGNETGPIYWYWVNSLISGILTHTKYVAANAFYAGTERGITTPLAAMIGKARELAGIGSDVDRVFFGEGMAATYGMLAATPTSLMAAARSIRAGQRVPLKSEIELRNAMIARGEKVPASMELSVNPVTGAAARPIGGILGRAIGLPGDFASGIHTFFKVMGERAGIEAEAYHGAAAEGLDPTDAQFWVRRTELAANPTEAMRQKAVEEAYKSTFMQELGPHGKAFQKFTKDIPGLKWIFPFTHIPINLMKATYEYTPAAILDSDMRAALKGEKGQQAQDMATARMVAGSALMAWFTHQALSGRATGDMPRDQKERDAWKLEGKQPNSILIGDHWVSFSKFGPAGDLANIGANLGSVVQVLREGDDDAMEKATWRATEAAGRLIIDEVGFQSLNNLVEAIADPDRFGSRWVGSQAATFLPYSSFLTQTASVIDPSMREAKTIIDSLKYRIPLVREALLPKRDWTGAPVDNPQYGNIIRQRQRNVNAVDMEAELLGIHAAPPANRVGTIKLPPRMYDEYQVTAGTLTRQALEQLIRQPTWYDMPVFAREEVFKKTITASRQQAAAIIQMRHPEIIQQGLDNIRNRIEGNKPTKLQDAQ